MGMILRRTFGQQIFAAHGTPPEPSVSVSSSLLTATGSGSDYGTQGLDRQYLTGGGHTETLRLENLRDLPISLVSTTSGVLLQGCVLALNNRLLLLDTEDMAFSMF